MQPFTQTHTFFYVWVLSIQHPHSNEHTDSNSGFSILAKATLACRLEQPTSNLRLVDDMLYLLSQGYPTMRCDQHIFLKLAHHWHSAFSKRSRLLLIKWKMCIWWSITWLLYLNLIKSWSIVQLEWWVPIKNLWDIWVITQNSDHFGVCCHHAMVSKFD